MPSLRDLRRATADRVAPFELATSGVLEVAPSGSRYVGTSLDGSRRRVVSSDLVSLDALGTGPETPPDALKNDWLYLLTDPPEQRRIPEASFVGYARADEAVTGTTTLTAPDAPVAYLDVENGFRAIVPPGTEFEIHSIPPRRGGRSAGTHTHINRALTVMLREDTVQIPGETGRTTYDVTATFPWLTIPGLFIAAQYVQSQAGVESWAIPGASLRFDADRVLLTAHAAVATGQTFPARVLRPLSTWIKPVLSSAWVESSVGLVDEEDTCLGNADSISLVAAFYVAEEQAHACVVGSPEALWWQQRASAFAQRSVFLRDQRTRRPRYAGSTFPDNVSVDGPYAGRWGGGYWR